MDGCDVLVGLRVPNEYRVIVWIALDGNDLGFRIAIREEHACHADMRTGVDDPTRFEKQCDIVLLLHEDLLEHGYVGSPRTDRQRMSDMRHAHLCECFG